MSRASVVIPVKDGARYLEEVLDAVAAEQPDEILVIDSGSRDGSAQIARAAGIDVLEIPAESFGHGRTRNLGAERTSGDLICFLTQDATPVPGWLAAYRSSFSLADNVGAAYGPHLPREGTSPMIARELTEFFAMFSPSGEPTVQGPGDPTFLSNANACYSRRCWEEIRFRDVDYSEDQAFGVDMVAAGWVKVYQPSAGVLHAHDYPWRDFMRRYFDEYRGLRGTIGHVEQLRPGTLRYIANSVAADRRWIRERGAPPTRGPGWVLRSAAHHGGRHAFSALGSRAEVLPGVVQRQLSLEGGAVAAAVTTGPEPLLQQGVLESGVPVPAVQDRHPYDTVARVMHEGSVPLLPVIEGMADRERLRVAMLMPQFGRGSGGHNILFQILSRLEQRGHICSVWVADQDGWFAQRPASVIRQEIVDWFAPIEAPVFCDLGQWSGADVVIATGWQTVHPALALDRTSARVYMVNDYEPDFHMASSERVLAEDTYTHGLHCVASSPWLRDLMVAHGATADVFQFGVDHDTYQVRPVARRRDTVIYYARYETARRAVPHGLLALTELHRRRPEVRIALFGTPAHIYTPFHYEHLGILSPTELSWLYSQATVGLCLSLTNFSLMPQEMMACGLPCVELAGVSAEGIFGEDGPIELAPLDPWLLADALERLLDDRELWEQRSAAGIDFAARQTWDNATDAVEAGMRHALRLRERGG